MEDPRMLWKAFVRSGSPEIYLQYRQAAEAVPMMELRSGHVYQNRSDRTPGGRDQRG